MRRNDPDHNKGLGATQAGHTSNQSVLEIQAWPCTLQPSHPSLCEARSLPTTSTGTTNSPCVGLEKELRLVFRGFHRFNAGNV